MKSNMMEAGMAEISLKVVLGSVDKLVGEEELNCKTLIIYRRIFKVQILLTKDLKEEL
jgi:hypothetical protein